MIRNLKQKLFTAPYSYLPWAVFVYFIVCNFYYPTGPIHTFSLGDTDDYMRLNQAIAWVNGQSWYDLGHPRLDPQNHVVISWSRLVDIPLALLIWPLSFFMKIQYAALLSAFIVPLAILGLLFFPTLLNMARPLVPKHQANLIAVLFLLSPPLTTNFLSGRVDHHSYQITIAAFGFLSLYRLWLCPKSFSLAIASGIAFAAGLWIGGESLPSLTLFSGLLGFIAAWKGGTLLPKAALFGVTLSATSLLELLIAKKPEDWLLLDMTWFSYAYVLYAFSIGGVLLLLWILGNQTQNKYLRLSLFGSLCFFSAMIFFFAVPKAVLGPYADIEILSQSIILDNVGEAQPMTSAMGISWDNLVPPLHRLPIISRYLFIPLIGFFTALYLLITRKRRERALWAVNLIYILLFGCLSLFWQLRTNTFFWLFILPPVTRLAWLFWENLGKKYNGRTLYWAEVFSFGFITFIPGLFLPFALAGRPIYPDVIFFPSTNSVAPKKTCNPDIMMEYLSDPKLSNKNTKTILGTMNDGPQILFWTPHNVLSAPYNVKGNRDSFDFFSSRNDDQAYTILKNKNVNFVLLCKKISSFYATIRKDTAFKSSIVYDTNNQILSIQSDKKNPTLIERLVVKKPPDWLKPVEVFLNKDYLLYEVLPVKEAPKIKPPKRGV